MKRFKRGTPEYAAALHWHMMRAELEFVGDNGGGVFRYFEGLAQEAIEEMLREMGFRLKAERPSYVEEKDAVKWVVTTSGISVELLSGFCIHAEHNNRGAVNR